MRGFLLPVALVCGASISVGAQSGAASVGSSRVPLASVTISPGPVIVISGAGPLPSPTIGVLHSPERIYLDFAGVAARPSNTPGDGDVVTAVRAAQHSLDPLVARIVIDLKQASQYRVDRSQRASGRLTVSLTPNGQAAAPAPAVTMSAAPSVSAPRAKPADPSRRQYVSRVQQALDDASALRQVLTDLDRGTLVSPDRLQPAEAQLTRLRDVVDGLHPPPSLSDAHDLLRSALGFATTALTLSAHSTATVPGNASSAAAGAILMLERTRAELQDDASKIPSMNL